MDKQKYMSKIVKGILNKPKAENKDPYLSILSYRNTPIDNLGSPESQTEIKTSSHTETVKTKSYQSEDSS